MRLCRQVQWISVCTLLVAGAVSVYGHNGQAAIAAPVAGIVVDGDFSDWPAGMRQYAILLPEYGRSPRDGRDFTGRFRIGYDAGENALYLAVEVQDESIVIDDSAARFWNTRTVARCTSIRRTATRPRQCSTPCAATAAERVRAKGRRSCAGSGGRTGTGTNGASVWGMSRSER